MDALENFDQSMRDIRQCPHCGNGKVYKHGRDSRGSQRFRCRPPSQGGCGRTFNGRTGTPFARMRKPERWSLFLQALSAGHRSLDDLHKFGEVGVSRRTLWRWRNVVLEALCDDEPKRPKGIVEVDETYFRESFNGSRGWKRGIPPALSMSSKNVTLLATLGGGLSRRRSGSPAGSHRRGIRTIHGRFLDLPERSSRRGGCHPRRVEERRGSNRRPLPKGAFQPGKGKRHTHPVEVLRQQTGERCVETISSGASQVDPGRSKTRTQRVPRAKLASQRDFPHLTTIEPRFSSMFDRT